MTRPNRSASRRFLPLSGLLCGSLVWVGCSFRHPELASVDPVVFAAEFRESSAEPVRVELPATVAVARIGYSPSRNERRSGQGVPLTILRTPDAAGVGPLRELEKKLDSVREVWVLQPEMVAGLPADDTDTIRRAAQRFNADLLVAYSLSTEKSNKFHLPFLSVLTLGFIPNATAHADVTVRAALVEPRSGYVFERFEAHSRKSGLTNYHVVHEDEEKAARQAEAEAFERLLEEVEKDWPGVITRIRGGAN